MNEPKEVSAAEFAALSPTTLADCLPRAQIMEFAIRPLWPSPRIAGPAYTVRCCAGDNLMLHAAIYRAPPGSVIVAEAGDLDYALAGGNVCAVAQRRGVAAFVLDGVIRDLARFADLGSRCSPKVSSCLSRGRRSCSGRLGEPVLCGGVNVAPGDMIVGDEEGIVVVPRAEQSSVLAAARKRAAADAAQSLDAWEKDHRQRVEDALSMHGFKG
jgi:4-hydroxy-4-methyl-2-oxoglutarate aldolase